MPTGVINITISGKNGKSVGGIAPTTGIIDQLGALGARPEIIGTVSDGDGALCALTVAAKLADMRPKNDRLEGDVIICTHICLSASTTSNYPVPFIDAPVPIYLINQAQVTENMDVIFGVNVTKGNSILNYHGLAITPPIMQGYILLVSFMNC